MIQVALLLTFLGICAHPRIAAAAMTSQQALQPVSANFKDVDFDSAVQFLADAAGVNIVLSPKAREVAKPVTVHLVEMPLRRALDYLVKGQGLMYRYDDQAIFIATQDELDAEPLQTKVFFLKQGAGLYADFEPISADTQGVAQEATNIKKMSTIRDTLDEVIPSVSGSSMLLDERTGALIVTHVPYYLDQVAQLLDTLDVDPIEIRIQSRFVEISLEDSLERGFEAALTAPTALTKRTEANGSRGPGLQLASLGSLLHGTGVNFSNFTNQANGLNLTLQGILTGTQYQAVLHALAETQRTKTLSAPQVTTLNNQTASLKVVTEFVYASRYEASVVREDLNGDGDFGDTINGVNETRFVNVPQDFVTKDLGILLNVTPSVGSDLKTITLALKPEVSEQNGSDTFNGEVSLPRFTTRNLETTVVVEDGQTIVLGGLMRDTTTRTVTKVPGVSKIPVVGDAFTKHNDSMERSNLLIFVTASLVNPQAIQLAQHDSAQ